MTVNAQSSRVHFDPQPLLQLASHHAADDVQLAASAKTESLGEEDKGQIAATYLKWDIAAFEVVNASSRKGWRGRIRALLGG